MDELGDEAGSWEVLYCSIGLSFLSFFLCSFSFVFFFFCSSSLPAFIPFAYNRDSIALVDPKATPVCIMHSKEVKCMSPFSSCRL